MKNYTFSDYRKFVSNVQNINIRKKFITIKKYNLKERDF